MSTQVRPNINLRNQSIFEIVHRFGVVEVPKALRESVKPVSSKMPGSPPLPKDVERLDIRTADFFATGLTMGL
jgi:hypothetical protein